MNNKRLLAYSTNNPVEAELIKQYLFNNGIQAFILNKMDTAYHFGDIEILVYQDDLIRTKRKIEEYLANE